MRSTRLALHGSPELSDNEGATAALIALALRSWGLNVVEGVGGAGVVGSLTAGNSSRTIGLRADMDALPITEANAFAHRSKSAGVMHACGHDGHVAMLLGAAERLAKQPTFDGTVHFVFQPAEENAKGAKSMMADGLFSRFPMDAVYALHNWPALPAGTFGAKPGPVMASCSTFNIEVRGTGGHGAQPQDTRDPITAALQVAQGLSSILTRNKSAVDPAVISITQLHAGTTFNVIPDQAVIGGTVRAFDGATLDMIEKRMREIADGIALALQCTAEVCFHRSCVATVNTQSETDLAADAMRDLVGSARVVCDLPPAMTGDDFGFMLQERPGCYAFIGNGPANGRQGIPLHSPHYDFNDDILELGANYWARLVERALSPVLNNDPKHRMGEEVSVQKSPPM